MIYSNDARDGAFLAGKLSRGFGALLVSIGLLGTLIGTGATAAAATSTPSLIVYPATTTIDTSGLTAGAVRRHFQIGSMSAETITPPSSFHAATASAAQRAAYGIPPEPPASNPLHAPWEDMIHDLRWAPVTALAQEPPASVSTCPGSFYFCSTGWSGNIDNGGQGAFADIETYDYEPSIDTTQCSSNPNRGVYLWEGLGGQFPSPTVG